MTNGDHVFAVSSLVGRPREEVFTFFSDAANLEQITPPQLRFRITSPVPVQMGVGALIDYRLKLFGIPFGWKTRITAWEPGVCFVDEQLEGPYTKWVHTHKFRDRDGGTEVDDSVLFRLPLFPLGEIALPAVKLQLRYIFNYRSGRIKQLLGA
ncbi:MAG: SRPBCC family protein [Gemmatimonadota bacterium]|nr:SRPBCC family protein [Gemmatimonadota bacterium]